MQLTKGSRIKITDLRRGGSKTISYDHALNDIGDMAQVYLESIGIKINALAMTKDGSMLLTEDFETKLK